MQTAEQHIKSLNAKLQELIKRYLQLQKKAAQQETEIQSLKKQQESNLKTIKQLEEKELLTKSAGTQLNNVDKKALEQLIARYIREIDKCIALLSE